MSKYVIIGNSAAAVGCIEGIRSLDKSGEITVISRESQHTYSRPLISYLLQGKTDRQKMLYRPLDFYQKNNCAAMFSENAIKVDSAAKQVTLESGKTVEYEKLLIATGSKPFIPPFKGLETVKNKFTFMSLDDAEALQKAITPFSKVLIVGAGLIGLKCAEGICDKVYSVTVADIADKILPSILDADGAGTVKSHIEEHGVKFLLKDGVSEFIGNRATLSSGKFVDFDILVIAVGVRPNTELVKEAGGSVNKGIVTDEYCKTTLPDIYAAGDCTESLDITSGENRILALLPNAYMQGECAGVNMAGGSKKYEKAIAMNAIGFFGLHIITAGSYTGKEFTHREGKNYKKLFCKDNRLKGFILVGDIERAGIYTALIREEIPLDSIDFDLVFESPQLMAFKKIERVKFLGEVRK